MNERIRELMAQATKVVEPNDPDYRHELFDKEKFAELIILECAKVAFNDWCDGTNEGSSQMAILKHFGVAE
jgi:hypothetical protein